MGIRLPSNEKPSIDIDGPDGNAFALMGYASNLSKQLGFNTSKILTDMRKKDYEHLLKVFDKNFGEYVDLTTRNKDYMKLFHD